MEKLKEMTFPEKRWSVLSPTKGKEIRSSLNAANLTFLSSGMRKTWSTESHMKSRKRVDVEGTSCNFSNRWNIQSEWADNTWYKRLLGLGPANQQWRNKKLSNVPIIYILRSGNSKRPHGARNRESEFMVNERASFPSKRDCTKDEKEAMPLEAEVSLRRRMKQNMLITALIVTSGLKVTGENISRQITLAVKLEREVTNP